MNLSPSFKVYVSIWTKVHRMRDPIMSVCDQDQKQESRKRGSDLGGSSEE